MEYRVGASGGGFDRLHFKFRTPLEQQISKGNEPDLSIPLNRRPGSEPLIAIPVPFYGAGMSYGSVSEHVMVARAIAAKDWGTFTCTGEGGYPDLLKDFKNHVITQVATDLFGVEERTIQYAPIVEFKYA